MSDDLVKRLSSAITTMTNDDTSEAGTEKRQRFIERVNAMQDARDRIEALERRLAEAEERADAEQMMREAEQEVAADWKADAERLRAALRPFVEYVHDEYRNGSQTYSLIAVHASGGGWIGSEDLRRAEAAYHASKEPRHDR